MAADPLNVYLQYSVIGMREDLGPVVYNIDPIESPLMNSIARGTTTQTKHEWQTDILDAAGFNVRLESNAASFEVITPTVRPYNRLQISDKTLALSMTLQAVELAGRANELGYQLARLAKSLKRDCEFTISQNQAIVDGDATTARALASYECWITGTNADRDATSGADASFTAGTPTTAPTDSSAVRALQENMMTGVFQSVWTAGGDVNLVIAGPHNKRIISGFAGNSTRFDIGEDQRLTAAIAVYISDYGEHRIVASRFSRDRSLLCVDTEFWSMNFLRPFKETPLAKTGDAEQRLMNVEYTLCCYNKSASGVVADLSTA